ncbi:MAG TPA: Hsp70 family protein [Caulobacteraceae bacterium]|nr:Hsp70 family protein [Caulobacteraceae bacterium]
MSGSRRVVGVDFGTTNTVVSALGDDGEAHLAAFAAPRGKATAFRSALSFHGDERDPSRRVVGAGPWAIETYAEEPLETRFIQSFKTYAASPLFQETRILGRRYEFDDLLSAYLLRLRAHGEDSLPSGATCIVGRPVNFAGQRADPDLALRRYGAAFARMGFPEIRYVFEPVAAAFFFARKLTHDATVLVGDFGGGTSDFSIVRFERQGGRLKSAALANAGVGLAGDAFDYRIIDNLVSPALGKGSSYRAFDNVLPIPNRYYTAFARWEQLALLRASRDMRDIRALLRTALEPEKIGRLVEVLDLNLGYRLYQSVSALKEGLSAETHARFLFEGGDTRIEREVAREDFEAWIAPELAAISAAVDEALARARLGADDLDRIFLTGGSSFVPAVRRLFADRFGVERVEGGGELVSIAAGLAYIGAEPDLDVWSQRAVDVA